jgi:Cu(I)/Ag(I) efflux system periplasmic protein CusF
MSLRIATVAATFITALTLSLSATAQSPLTQGEVRKVDKTNRKITLKHDEIKNLDMPPMTMVFTAKDPVLLEKVRVGDKVRFSASQENGIFFVIAIEPVTP